MSHDRIYMDYAAATPLDERVLETMFPYWADQFANAGSIHREGVTAHNAIEKARSDVARLLGVRHDTCVFTSGGTESNQLAVLGTIRRLSQQGRAYEDMHIVTTPFEHSSVRACMHALETQGVRVSYVPVDAQGFVRPHTLQETLTPNTVLVSLIYAHNEIGTIQDLPRLTKLIRAMAPDAYVHTDATQAPAWLPVHMPTLGVDLLTLDAHKFYGPKGVGCLIDQRGTLAPLCVTADANAPVRPGTPATPLIVGFAHALALVYDERDEYTPKIHAMRDRMIERILDALPTAILNGPTGAKRLANNVHISIPQTESEELVLTLDTLGVACSSRSACLMSAQPGSHTLYALEANVERAASGVRLTLGRQSTENECAQVVDRLTMCVKRLQAMHVHT